MESACTIKQANLNSKVLAHYNRPMKSYPNPDVIVDIATDKQNNVKLHLY